MQVPTRALLRHSPTAAINDSAQDRESGESTAGASFDGDTGTCGGVRCGSGLGQVNRCWAMPHPLGRRPASRDGPSKGRCLRPESAGRAMAEGVLRGHVCSVPTILEQRCPTPKTPCS